MELCPLKSRVFLSILALQGIHPSNPSFRLANECVGLVHALDKLPIEPGSYYMMDKGYIDFHRLYTLFHQARAFFVTRAKDNLRCEVVSEAEVDKEAGLISDMIVRLTTYKSAKSYPEENRLVVYEDYANNTVYTFMTNDFDLPALSIAELYRERWKVESFFKCKFQLKSVQVFQSKNAQFYQS